MNWAEMSTYTMVLYAVFAASPTIALVLLFVDAPYGRHDSAKWGPGLDARVSWVLLEGTSFFAFVLSYLPGDRALEPLPLFFALCFAGHYFHRTFVFPFRMRGVARKHRIIILAFGLSFNMANGYLNGTWLGSMSGALDASWVWDPRFAIGVAMFFGGLALCQHSDQILFSLRGPGETGYKIPRGGGFELVSAPNYLGEMVQWLGFAIATWSLPALAFFLFTCANLAPRALSNHRWYLEKFDDYPAERRRLIPYVW